MLIALFVIDSASALVRPAAPSRVLAWLHASDRALMAALLSLHLAPLCLFAWFPTRDGPSHLEGSLLLLLRWRQPDGAMLRDWYTPVMQLAPNWLDHVALAGLSLVLDAVSLVAAGGTVVALAAWTSVVDVSLARRLRPPLRDKIRRAAATQRQLHEHYRLVHVSQPGQHLQVWRLESDVP